MVCHAPYLEVKSLHPLSFLCTLNCYLSAPQQLLRLRWNKFYNEVTESQSVIAAMPRDLSHSAAVGSRQKINITNSRWLTDGEWAELRAENFVWSGHSFGDGQYLKCGNKFIVASEFSNFVHPWQGKQNCRLRKREWLIFLGFRVMSRKITKISCNHFKVKSRFSSKIIR